MSALDLAPLICRLLPRKRPSGRSGAGPASGSAPQAASPTEFVDGSWRVIGASRRIAQVSAPMATGAAVTGGTLLVCEALGLPNALMETGRRLLAGDGVAETSGDGEVAATTLIGDGMDLLLTGPSIFPPGIPYREGARLVEGGRPLTQPEPAPVPEPASIGLFGVPLALMAALLVCTSARRRRLARTCASRRAAGAA